MRDVRKVELKEMISFSEYLASKYPQYFKFEKYEHPILGTRASLTIIPEDKIVDIQLLNQIIIDYDKNCIIVHTDYQHFLIKDFIKDETVI